MAQLSESAAEPPTTDATMRCLMPAKEKHEARRDVDGGSFHDGGGRVLVVDCMARPPQAGAMCQQENRGESEEVSLKGSV